MDMEALYGFLTVIAIIIALAVDYFIAIKFAEIAEMKGHYDGCYFWFTFLLGPVGMLMVIALPSTYVAPKSRTPYTPPVQPTATPPVQPTATPNTPKTNYGGTAVNAGTDPVHAKIVGNDKVCPKCGQLQRGNRSVCWSCGQPFDN
jgi:hypothetical protein